jgi:hypothetical protein
MIVLIQNPLLDILTVEGNMDFTLTPYRGTGQALASPIKGEECKTPSYLLRQAQDKPLC